MKEYKSFTNRKLLIVALPLDTPFGINICPTTYCNFKCVYCKHALSKKEIDFKESFMDIDFFKMLVEQIKEFPHKLQIAKFCMVR